MWAHIKEFDSMVKLTQYLTRIQNLEKAEVKNLGGENWRLSFNLF